MTTTHIHILLDRSGSMSPMADDVIGGINQFLTDQQGLQDDALVTLVQFDTENPFEVLTDALSIHRVRPLSHRTFQPRGGTPLLDATGKLVAHASARAEMRKALGQPAEDILVVTFTDGEENQSHLYTRTDIVTIVQAKQAQGWTFAFLGAGLDAYGEAGAIGVDVRSTQAWAPDGPGVRAAMASASAATLSHRRKVARGESFDKADFFEGAKEAELDRQRRHGN